MNQGRWGHGVIVHQGQFIVVGGYSGPLRTERCELKDESIQCKTVDPELSNYRYYPEMMSVTKYCYETNHSEKNRNDYTGDFINWGSSLWFS